ncbi:MAG: hypothetical protein U1A78_19900 [Polyangia bacterium]
MRLGPVLGVAALGTVGACSSGGGRNPTPDASAAVDAGPVPEGDLAAGLVDLAKPADLSAPLDLPTRADLAGPLDQAAPADLAPRADLAPPADLWTAPPDMTTTARATVDIYVDNRCKMDVLPKVIDVAPAVTSLTITYYNRSRDYAVDVWMSYGGGYKDLMTGASWAERFEHCRLGRRPYSEYADISTACSSYRLMINCK